MPVSVPSLSPSRANDFVQCPLLFRLRVIDRIPEPPSAAAARGTLVHKVLEELYNAPAAQRTVALAEEAIAPAWTALVSRQPELEALAAAEGGTQAWFTTARTLLDRYFTLEDPQRLEPAEREAMVEHQLADGPLLRGIVDRIDVAPDGAVRIVDYKTGKSPKPQYSSSAAFQMRFYALVLWRSRGVMPAALQLIYLGDGQILRNEPTPDDIDATARRIEDLWGEIQRAAAENTWRPRRSALCNWCAHQPLCPVFGGTPPPLDPLSVQRATGVLPPSLP